MQLTTQPQALSNVLFIVVASTLAAYIHLFWLKTRLAQKFAKPIDGGRTWRGKRWFGDNKRWCGLMALPPAAAMTFAAFSSLKGHMPIWFSAGLWNESVLWHAALGFACGLVFMLAELPNSFIKRQLGIAPGASATSKRLTFGCAVVDRVDSTLAVLLVCQLFTTQSWQAGVLLLGVGVVGHALLSTLQYSLGLKNRAL